MEVVTTEHIEQKQGVCGGKPCIAGTRIRVQDIVLMTERGDSPDEIVSGYPHLKLSDVYAALAFYHDNQAVIDQQIRDSVDFVTELEGSKSRTPPQGDSVSS